MSGRNPGNSWVMNWGRSMVFLLAAAVLVVSLVMVSMNPSLRVRLDATKTRAYSLSPRTTALLENLEGAWRIAVVMVESERDQAVARQIDEVLDRAAAAAPNLQVDRIDPSDPASLSEYESLLRALRDRELDGIKAYESALERGERAFAELVNFASTARSRLDSILASMADRQSVVEEWGALASALQLLANQGHLVLDRIREEMQPDGMEPLPNYQSARAILIEGLQQWSRELKSASRRMRTLESATVDHARLQSLQSAMDQQASKLAVAADGLLRLEELDYAVIAAQLSEGEAAVIIGPDEAMAIPASQLFATNLIPDEIGQVRFDQRFRGEQVLASAIATIQSEQMPTVIFVHGEERSILAPDPMQLDATGASTILSAARFNVLEWPVTLGSQPVLPTDAPRAWVVLPSATRVGFELSKGERRLLEETSHLLDQGESVLINLYPSYMPRYGQPDPWASLLEPYGIEASTGTVLLEESLDEGGEPVVQMFQQLNDFPAQHPIAAALNGQRLLLPLPVPIHALGGTDSSLEQVGSIAAGEARWLEEEWTPSEDLGSIRRNGRSLDEPVDVIWSHEQVIPGTGQTQRILVVGSGPWMLTNIADVVVSIGGERVTLLNPGNHELMFASVAWLSGMDELVAKGPLSQDVSRIRDLSSTSQGFFGWLLVLGLPGSIILLGVVVYLRRRN